MRWIILIVLSFFLFSCKQELSSTPPIADFSANNNGCIEPCTLTFYNNSRYFTSIQWDFGNGQTGGDSIVAVPYDSAGTYTVSLEAQNSAGEKDVEQKIVTVSPGRLMQIDQIELQQISMLNESGTDWDNTSNPDVFISVFSNDTIYSNAQNYWPDIDNSILPMTLSDVILLSSYFDEHHLFILDKDGTSSEVMAQFSFFQYEYTDYPAQITFENDSTIVTLDISWIQ